MKIGIKKKDELLLEKKVKKKRNTGPAEIFWQPLVKVWFDVFAELVPKVDGKPAKPSFIGAEPHHMKSLVKELKKRAEDNNVEWTLEEAKKRWRNFLVKSYEDDFISKNFMLRIISNNRTKIFNNQITKKNGTNQQGYTSRGSSLESPKPTIKPKGGFGRL